jgi:hypothetical protein
VSIASPDFASIFLNIYNTQQSLHHPIQFEKTILFQIKAEVVKNSFHDSFIQGLKDIDTVKYLLTSVDGGGIA